MENVKNTTLASKLAKATIPFIITLSIATVCYLLTMYTPELSFTAGSWFGIRVAHVLKPLAISTPYAATGIALGGYYTNISAGKIGFGLYSMLPIANLILGLMVYKLARKGPQTGIMYHIKNVILLSVYAIIITFLARLNHGLLKFPELAFLAPKFQSFYWSMMLGRVISSVSATLFGYPLLLMWNGVSKELKNRLNKE